MHLISTLDIAAISWFLLVWGSFSFAVDRSSMRHKTLSSLMNQHRHRWMLTMSQREIRIVDTAIITGLQNGTAFFASTSLLAIGAGFALLSSTDLALQISKDLGLSGAPSRGVWEAKVLFLITIFVYAFFKFGWAYRLFNYTSILIGAFPQPGEVEQTVMDKAIHQTAEINTLAGRHFNLGLRAFFFSLAVFGWFIHPVLFMATTTFVGLVLVRRQFYSRSHGLALELVADIPSQAKKQSIDQDHS